MPEITKISTQKNNAERYNIFLDGKYAFSADEQVLIQFGLMKGKVLDDWEIDEIIFGDEIRKAYNKALHFLGFRMRSEHEVKEKLMASGFGEAVALEAISKLKEQKFLDDDSFSKALLETRKRTAKKGPGAIKQELARKGISKDLQEEALEAFPEEEQRELAIELAAKIAARSSGKTPQQIRQKIQDSLMRKGYSYDIISSAIERIGSELEPGEDEWDELTEKTGEKAWRTYSRKHSGNELRRRVQQAMYQKGIPPERISRFIEAKEEETEDE
ncbi:Regulatory protein recX [Bhargavaea cecembensis DSE10]|uniref:Regulatory protein RecX n=1 Tax=Bhargavaea cecembensis DSE10 TaxID=1235279 RepID=M7NE57_9BACL|nr:recombination regulator RecX [Bhargavaea cecembensis]EMR05481.1 Regulatory protein recX [Bhargavaea cecembensis DSE10]